MEAFAIKWFALYYPLFGILVLVAGGYLAAKPESFQAYLVNEAENEQPPRMLRNMLKYVLLFTIPCLVFSFIPFSWPEFLFSVWCLLLVYLAGSQLVRWQQLRSMLVSPSDSHRSAIRWLGVILLSAGLVIFLLEYLLIKRAQLI